MAPQAPPQILPPEEMDALLPGREAPPPPDSLQAALLKLPVRDRLVLTLHYWSGLKLEEIAHALKLTPAHAGVLLARAREKLRHHVKTSL